MATSRSSTTHRLLLEMDGSQSPSSGGKASHVEARGQAKMACKAPLPDAEDEGEKRYRGSLLRGISCPVCYRESYASKHGVREETGSGRTKIELRKSARASIAMYTTCVDITLPPRAILILDLNICSFYLPRMQCWSACTGNAAGSSTLLRPAN